MATIKQIAELAGVSRGTVDRVLNHRGSVNKETEKKVLEIARQLNYKPNKAGIALAAQKKQLQIGILVFDEKNPFFDEVLAGIQKKAEEMDYYGCDIQICRVEMNAQSQLKALEELKQANINGLILSPYNDEKVAEKINEFVEAGIEVVTVNTDIEGTRRLAYVGSDYFKCGRTAGGLMGMITQGKAKLGIITGSSNVLCHTRRIEGFRDVVEKEYPQIEICAIEENEDDEFKSYAVAEKMLQQYPDMDALFLAAGGVYGACRAVLYSGKEKQVRIISYDTIESTKEMLRQGIITATICQQPIEQGARAMETLLTYLASGERPQQEENYVDLSIKIKENLV